MGRQRVGIALTHVAFGSSLLIALLLMMVGDSSAKAEDAADDKVVLQLPQRFQFQFAGYIAAIEKGFYRDEGLAVELREGSADRRPNEAVLDGAAEFGTLGSEILHERLQGQPVVVLAVILQHSPYALVTRADSNVFTPTDLTNRRIMLELNHRDVEFLAMFRKEGILPDTLRLVKNDWNVDSLITGKIDAVGGDISDLPFELDDRGVDARLIRPVAYGIDFYGDCLFTSERQIVDHPERVAAFRRASLLGWQYAMDHRDELAELIIERYRGAERNISRANLLREAEALDELIVPRLVEIGHMNPGRWRHMADTYAQLRLVGSEVDTNDRLEGFLYDSPRASLISWFRYALLVLGGLLGILILVVAWNVQLHRMVLRQTVELDTRHKHMLAEKDERIKALALLQQSEEQFRQIADHSNVVLSLSSPDLSRVLYVNPAFERLTGMAAEWFVNEPSRFVSLIHPEDRERAIWQTMNRLDEEREVDYRIVRRDGEVRWLAVHYLPVRARDGTIQRSANIATDITRQVETERRLRESIAQFRAVVEEMPVLLDAFDTEGQLIFWNRECERVTGYAAAELIGNPSAMQLLYPDDEYRERMITEWQDRTNDYYNWEWTITCKDGSTKVIAWSNLSKRINIAGWPSWGVGVNVTERTWAERAVRDSEARYRAIVETTEEWIWEVDREGRHTYSNQAIESILGYSVYEIIGKSSFPLIHPDDRQEVADVFSSHVAQKRGWHCWTNRWRHHDGDDRFLESNAVPLLDSTGELIGFRGADRDITERRLAQFALRRSEEQYRLLVSATTAIVWTASRDGRITEPQPPWEDYTGQDWESEREWGWLDAVHPDDRDRLLTAWEEVAETHQVYTDEARLFHAPTQEYRHCVTHAVPLLNPDGSVREWAGTIVDVHERQQAQAERERLIEELEQKNAELERFTYTVSHDLKSPIVTIKGFLGFLQEDLAAGKFEDVQADMDRIANAADRMKRLLDELLELSRIGRIVGIPERAALTELAGEAVEVLAGALAEKDVKVDIADDLPVVFGDRIRLLEVFQNIIDNAIKFMGDQSHPQITISCCNADGESVICVSDNGIGIAPEHIHKIFGLFEQLNQKIEGTGIGLAIVKRIIEIQGGRIWVESEGRGAGTQFYFTLPKHLVDATELSPPDDHDPGMSTASPPV